VCVCSCECVCTRVRACVRACVLCRVLCMCAYMDYVSESSDTHTRVHSTEATHTVCYPIHQRFIHVKVYVCIKRYTNIHACTHTYTKDERDTTYATMPKVKISHNNMIVCPRRRICGNMLTGAPQGRRG